MSENYQSLNVATKLRVHIAVMTSFQTLVNIIAAPYFDSFKIRWKQIEFKDKISLCGCLYSQNCKCKHIGRIHQTSDMLPIFRSSLSGTQFCLECKAQVLTKDLFQTPKLIIQVKPLPKEPSTIKKRTTRSDFL